MTEHNFIDKNIWICRETYSLKLQNIHTKKIAGTIKGIKRCSKNSTLYLIEFLNHNRIWITEKEIKKNKK